MPTPQEFIDWMREEINPGAGIYPGLDDAIIGYASRCAMQPVIVYDEEKAVECLMRNNDWDFEEAQEFFDINVIGGYHGEGTPLFFVPKDKEW
jgi:hypothetical protein